MERRIHNFLIMSNVRNILEYRKDGTYFLFGPFKNWRIEYLYKKNPESLINYIDDLIMADVPYKLKFILKILKKDLLNS
jgi:hypothetical protein